MSALLHVLPLIICILTSYANVFDFQSNTGQCKHIQRRVIHCYSIRTEAQYFSELSLQELGESLYKGHDELAIFQHPFKRILSNHIFNFSLVNRTYEFMRLSKLILKNGEIESLASNVFSPFCSYITKLDLASNKIEEIPLNAFSKCGSPRRVNLMILNLSSNLIEVVHSLQSLSNKLSVIDLSNNSIYLIQPNAFVYSLNSALNFLKYINLSRNFLRTISYESFSREELGSSLSPNKHLPIVLNIQDNPLLCDCSLRWLVLIYSSMEFLSPDDPLCVMPTRLKDISLRSLRPLDLVCEPVITKSSRMMLPKTKDSSNQPTIIHVYEDDRLELNCVVFADPKPRTWWTFKDSVTIGKTLVDQVNKGRYFINTTILHNDSRNVSTTLLIDQVQITDSGQIRCVAGFYPGIFLQSERNETSELFQIEVHLRHYHVKASSMWTVAIIIAIVLFLVMCTAVFFWFKWMRKSPIGLDFKKKSSNWTLDSKNDHAIPVHEGNKTDYVKASTHILDLGPPMYNHDSATYIGQYNGSDHTFRLLSDSHQRLSSGHNISNPDDFDISAYGEEYRLLSDDLVRQPNDEILRGRINSPFFSQPARQPSSMRSITTVTNNSLPGETEL